MPHRAGQISGGFILGFLGVLQLLHSARQMHNNHIEIVSLGKFQG